MYLVLFWLNGGETVVEKGIGQTKEDAISYARELLVALRLEDSGYEEWLLGQVGGWDGNATETISTPTGKVILTPILMGSCRENKMAQRAEG